MLNYETTYSKAQKNVFSEGQIADGYNGHNTAVSFSLIEGVVYTLHPTGCFKTPYPKIFDESFDSAPSAFLALIESKYITGLASKMNSSDIEAGLRSGKAIKLNVHCKGKIEFKLTKESLEDNTVEPYVCAKQAGETMIMHLGSAINALDMKIPLMWQPQ